MRFLLYFLSGLITSQLIASDLTQTDFLFINKNSDTFPGWLTLVPSSSLPETVGEESFVIHKSTPESLLLTVWFEEKDGGFLRLIEKDGSGVARTLATNFYEGTSLPNRRTLLIPGPIADGTVLTFQSSDLVAPVLRILWQWTSPHTLPATASGADAAVLTDHTVLKEAEVATPSAPLPPSGTIATDFTATPLLAQPLKVPASGIVEFTALLDRLPRQTRLVCKGAGLPPNVVLECRVNGTRVGLLSPVPPSLKDPSWFFSETAARVVGWQEMAVAAPGSAWHSGENKIEFVPLAVGSENIGPDSFALKDLLLEATYLDDTSGTP